MICNAKWQLLYEEAKSGFSFGCCVRGLGFFKWGRHHTTSFKVSWRHNLRFQRLETTAGLLIYICEPKEQITGKYVTFF